MSLLRGLTFAGALLCCVSAVFGQKLPNGMPPISPAAAATAMEMLSGPPPLVYLVAQKVVQQDLKLEKAQTQKLQASQAKFAQVGLKLLQAKSPDDIKKQLEDVDKEVLGVLKEEQVSRLKEISLRVQGPPGLLSTEVSKNLELTEEQTDKLKELSSKDGKKVPDILTPEQLEKLHEMLGKTFKGKVDWPPTNLPGMPGGMMMPKK